MAKINGTNILLYAEIAPGVWQVIGCATSHTLNINADLPDATTKCSGGWAENIHGLRDWSVDMDALHDPENIINDDVLASYIASRTPIRIRFAGATGTVYYEGIGRISTWSKNADMEQPVSYSVTIVGKTPIYQYFMPLTVSTNAGGTLIVMTFTVDIADPTGKHAQFSYTESGNPKTFTAAALGATPNIVNLTVADAMSFGETYLLTYTPGDIVGAKYGTLAAFTAVSVTNIIPEP